jgi:uncharacterized protein
MRNHRTIDVLMPRTRQRILAAMLVHSNRAWYQSDLAKHLGVPSSSLQRELAALADAGILLRRRDGNRVYYEADSDCPILPELTGLLTKTVGVRELLADVLTPFRGRIDAAFVFGSIARGDERSASDVDLMVVGRVGLADLAPALAKAESALGRAVNASVYPSEELVKKVQAGHHFLKSVLNEAKLFIMGDSHDLEAIVGRRPDTISHSKQARAGRAAGGRRARHQRR